MFDASRAIQSALGHHQAGRLKEAESVYRKVLQSQPNHPDALHLLGVIAYQCKNYAAAVDFIERAIRVNNKVPEYFNNLGNALKDQGRLDEARSIYQRALTLNPNFETAHYNLGLAHQEKGEFEKAIVCHRRALALNPAYPDAHNGHGNALKDLGRFDEAIAAFLSAIALNPDFAHAHNNLGIVLQAQGEFDQAVACYQRALSLNPDYADAYSNLGLTLQDQGRVNEAEDAYHRALAINPSLASAHLNRGLTLLLKGEFSEGLQEYEWRFESAREVKALKARFSQPAWQGEALAGRKILLYCEQGLGDTLQFIRYASLVASHGGRVFVECQPGMKRLLQSISEIEEIIERGEAFPEFDVCCSLLSLPLLLGTTLDTIPADIPYLAAERDLVALWGERLERIKEFKIGLVWSGRPTNRTDRRRSCPLSAFTPLGKVDAIRLFSLQKGPATKQAHTPLDGIGLIDWTDKIDDFAQTAAFISNLDLVISVDTAVAHLTGALGKPVWLLCRFDSEWRWMLDREDSPWYPSMRIFRQRSPGNWEEVMNRVAAALADFARAMR